MGTPTSNQRKDFEQLECDVMLPGTIVEVQEEKEHLFKGYQKKDGTVVKDRTSEAVRFIFEFDGYKEKHYSRWMSFSYDERSNLFQKYLIPLVSGIEPYADFDIQQLSGMRIQATWGQKAGSQFQNIETIIPQSRKLVPKIAPQVASDAEQVAPEDIVGEEEQDIPF